MELCRQTPHPRWDGTCIKGPCLKTRIDATWTVLLEGPPRDLKGNEIDSNIATAKLRGAGRILDLEDDGDGGVFGGARGVVALRLDLVIGPTLRRNLKAVGAAGYSENNKGKAVRFQVEVVHGIRNDCDELTRGSMAVAEFNSKVDRASLALCGRVYFWRNAKSLDQTVAVSIKKVAVIPKE